MARILVLHVPDGADADQIVAQIEQDSGIATFESDDGRSAIPCEVLGLYAVPTKFCECGPSTPSDARHIVLGKTFGWRVHRECRRAQQGWQTARNLHRDDGKTSLSDQVRDARVNVSFVARPHA